MNKQDREWRIEGKMPSFPARSAVSLQPKAVPVKDQHRESPISPPPCGQPQGLPLQIQMQRVQWLSGGFFRAEPFIAFALVLQKGWQAARLPLAPLE